ncbi:MAG: excisionase [Lachnospiraceae bacterium]|nr:excisionase [Lachnospiraceae bacterium]
MKKYILMHKNIPVADMELDEASCAISAIGHVYEERHVPVGIPVKKGMIDRGALNEWWKGRAIPASRAGIKSALVELNLSTTQKLLEKCLGLSLSDQYWICPADSGIQWSQVNFFDNPFSDDVGNILFGQGSSSDHMSLMSPDNTSDGWLKKKWKIIDGKRCLIKGGSGATQQEPYNEVLASRMMERLDIPHVKYSLLVEDDYPYSVCEDFITPQTDLISAWHIMQTVKKPNHVSVYQHYLDCCDANGIPDIRESLDRMMVLDYLIVNEDRHQNNFGVVRNAETLEYLGAAPLFDSGTALWFDKPTAMIGFKAKVGCKPFKNSHEEQIKLVSSFDWLNLNNLYGIDEELRELVRGSVFIDDARCDALCRALKDRVEALTEIVNSHRNLSPVDDFRSDVTENIAYSGSQEEEPEQFGAKE